MTLDNTIIILGIFTIGYLFLLLQVANKTVTSFEAKLLVYQELFKYSQIQIMRARGRDIPENLRKYENDLKKVLDKKFPGITQKLDEL